MKLLRMCDIIKQFEKQLIENGVSDFEIDDGKILFKKHKLEIILYGKHRPIMLGWNTYIVHQDLIKSGESIKNFLYYYSFLNPK